MVSAIVLLTVERDEINSVADAIADIDGVSEVYSIAGRYDLAAIIRVKTNEDLANVVTERVRKVGGITSSETLISFRVYSRHDLERIQSSHRLLRPFSMLLKKVRRTSTSCYVDVKPTTHETSFFFLPS